MSTYTELRAKQKSRSHVIGAEGAMRKIAPLHRASIVELEVDESCAPECASYSGHQDERQGRWPFPKVAKTSKAERTEVAKFWRMAFGFGIAVFSVLLLVHWGVSK